MNAVLMNGGAHVVQFEYDTMNFLFTPQQNFIVLFFFHELNVFRRNTLIIWEKKFFGSSNFDECMFSCGFHSFWSDWVEIADFEADDFPKHYQKIMLGM